MSFSFLHLSIYVPSSFPAFCCFMFSFHPPTLLIPLLYPLSSQCPPLPLWKIFMTFFYKKKKNLLCSSHLRFSVSFCSLLCHLLPSTFRCFLIQFYNKMETALTKATKNLFIPTLNYLCSLLILQEQLFHFWHSTFLCAFKVLSSL